MFFAIACDASDATEPDAAAHASHDARVQDARTDAQDADVDAGADAGTDAALADPATRRAVIADFLAQLDREAAARCPCQTDAGDFESTDACLAVIGGAVTWEDCLIEAVAPYDTVETREALECRTRAMRERNDCLESTSCSDLDVAECIGEGIDCALPDLQVLTTIATMCPAVIYPLQ